MAILPQLNLIYLTRGASLPVAVYLLCLLLYRFLYMLNWLYRFRVDQSYQDPVAWGSGILQFLLFAVALSLVIRARIRDRKWVAQNDYTFLPQIAVAGADRDHELPGRTDRVLEHVFVLPCERGGDSEFGGRGG